MSVIKLLSQVLNGYTIYMFVYYMKHNIYFID